MVSPGVETGAESYSPFEAKTPQILLIFSRARPYSARLSPSFYPLPLKIDNENEHEHDRSGSAQETPYEVI